MTNQLIALKQANLEKDKKLKAEPYFIIIKLPSQPHNLRLTYSSYKNGRILQIDELDASDKLISSSEFRGKTCKGFCSADLKDLKVLLNQLKPKDYQMNKEILIEEYYKNN